MGVFDRTFAELAAGLPERLIIDCTRIGKPSKGGEPL